MGKAIEVDPCDIKVGDFISCWENGKPTKALTVCTTPEEFAAVCTAGSLPDGWVYVVTRFNSEGIASDGITFTDRHRVYVHTRAQQPVRTYDAERMAAEMFERDMERTAGMEWSVVVEIHGADLPEAREYAYRSDMNACFVLYDDYKRLMTAFGGEVHGNGWYFMVKMPDGLVHFVTLFAGDEQYDGVRLGNLPA